MSRFPRLAGLAAAGVLLVAAESSATLIDPIVRVRDGGSGSIPIFELPFAFDFGVFPGNPAPDSCVIGNEEAGTVLSCLFQNLTGETISQLDFSFSYGEDPTGLVFDVQDPDDLFADEEIDTFNAQFVGGGVPSGFCEGEFCEGGHFWIDLVGFPDFAQISMFARGAQVPEPTGLLLLGCGVAAAAILRRRAR